MSTLTVKLLHGGSRMSTGTAGEPLTQREQFPVDSLRYMEGKLGDIRKVIMGMAAKLAEQATPGGEPYRVEPFHVDQALTKIFGDFPSFPGDIGAAE